MQDEESSVRKGAPEAIFADSTSYRGDLIISAVEAWSTSRKQIYTTLSSSCEKLIDEAWKPDYQDIHIVHGISHAETTNYKPIMHGMGLPNAGTGSC